MKTIKVVISFIFILAFTNVLASSSKSCNCLTALTQEIQDQNSEINRLYKFKHNSFVKLGNDAEFLEGSNNDNVVILIHGFIASPFEVRELAESLNRDGHSVYMPLLYGFGAYGDMANEGKLSKWREQIREAVQLMSRCFKSVSLGGMSLGAALATDYYLTTKDSRITSLVLLSPYFDISQSIAKLLVGPLSSVKESVSLETLHSLSRSSDLVEILKNKKYYSNIMPFITLQEVFKLSEELNTMQSENLSKVPVLVVSSEYDMTINLEKVKTLPKRHFKNVSHFNMKADLKVPHQILFQSSNPVFESMARKIRNFIMVSSFKHR